MNDQVSQVKEAVDLVALIGERVKLSRSGSSFKGLCPFHSEKSPSFFVNPSIGRYMCFGCHETGDCFTFLEKYDNMTFGEALRYLAKKVGIELTTYLPSNEDRERELLLSVLSLAKEYYHYLLTEHPSGEVARGYLKDRGITNETIELFGLGYSLPSWDGLQRYLIGKKGFTSEDLLHAGLIIQSDRGGFYDRFRGRLMFPLTTMQGSVVGFSGRLLEKEAKEAKYINSPETELYHKSELLFGYSQLHRFIREKEEVLIVEGEFDLLSSVQAHVNNVVAIKGSAISEKQLKVLSRVAKRIIFSLDNDSAGMNATKRAIELARTTDVSLRALILSGGKDPDDIARSDPKLWREKVKQSVSVYEYLIGLAFARYDSKDGEGKKQITNELSPLLSSIPNAVEQAHYVQQVSKRLEVSEEVFLKEMRRHSVSVSPTPAKQEVASDEPKTREQILEEYLCMLLLHSEESLFPKRLKEAQELIQEGVLHRVIEAMSAVHPYALALVARSLPEELKDVFSQLYLKGETTITSGGSENEFEKVCDELIALRLKLHREELSKRISELERKSNLTYDEELELQKLMSSL